MTKPEPTVVTKIGFGQSKVKGRVFKLFLAQTALLVRVGLLVRYSVGSNQSS